MEDISIHLIKQKQKLAVQPRVLAAVAPPSKTLGKLLFLVCHLSLLASLLAPFGEFNGDELAKKKRKEKILNHPKYYKEENIPLLVSKMMTIFMNNT